MNPVVEALSLLTPFDIDRPKIRIGPNTDGGYIFADDISAHQTIISYGIGTEYRFDIEMAKRGHDVYMFDHMIESIQAENKKLHFFREGVAGCTDISQNLFSIKDHLHRHQIPGDRLILKMDVEGAEFDALEAGPDDTLDRFEQIVLEVHWLNNLDDLAFRNRFRRIFSRLNSAFTLFHVHANNWDGPNGLAIVSGIPVASLLELSYVRTASVHRLPSQTLYPTALDYPNLQGKDKLLWFYPFLPTLISQESFAACAERVEHLHCLESATKGVARDSEYGPALKLEIERLTEVVRDSQSGQAALRQQTEALFSRRAFRWLTRFANWPELTNLAELLRRQ
jgi:FkbM family methyltransferase